MKLVYLKYLETTSIIYQLMEYGRDGNEYGKIDGLFDVISLRKEYRNSMVSEVRAVDGEVNISKVKSVIWFL